MIKSSLATAPVALERAHEAAVQFWLEPQVELAADYGLGRTRINAARKIIEEHRDDIRLRG